jgi:hypothetical protein
VSLPGIPSWLGTHSSVTSVDSWSISFRINTRPVRPKLKCASCVWNPFYNERVGKVERVLHFIRYALRSLGWTNIYNLLPYEHRWDLQRFDTLVKTCSITCIMFVFDIFRCRETCCLLSVWLLHDIELEVPNFFKSVSITWTTGFMNRCLPRCASLTRSLVCSILFEPVIKLWIACSWLYRPVHLFLFLRMSCALHMLIVHIPSYGSIYSGGLISLHQLI